MYADPVNVLDFETLAEKRLDPMAWAYYAGGAGEEEETLRANRAAFRSFRLLQRCLIDVSHIDLSVDVLGTRVAQPILVAPTAFHGLAHPEAEKATARAAGAAQTIMTVSTLANTSLEAIAQEATGPLWFQLYVHRDRGLTRSLVQRAEAAGYRALALTVDTPVPGRRDRELRHRVTLPPHLGLGHLETSNASIRTEATANRSAFMNYVAEQLDPSLEWSIIDWLKQQTSLPVVTKGIQTPKDALLALEWGADAIYVSNHGGRQLDSGPGTLELLPAIVEAVDGRAQIYLDGGIRRGTDVLKALALGATAVFVGRPILWGLAVAGEAGVRNVLDILREELEIAMALTGCPRVADVDRNILFSAERCD